MTSSEHHQLANLLDEDDLYQVLEDSLNQKEIVKLCNYCGLSYDGVRTKSVPKEMLIADLVEEFYKFNESTQLIVKTLRKANTLILHKISAMTPDQIDEFLGADKGSNRSGQILFALAIDERQEVSQKVAELVESMENEDESIGFDVPFVDEILDQRLRDLTRENNQLQLRLETAENRLKRAQEGWAEARLERDKLLREKRSLEEKVEILVQRVENLSAGQEEIVKLSTQINQLQRENRKLNYSLREKERDEKKDAPNRFEEALQRNVADLRAELMKRWEWEEDRNNALDGLVNEIVGIKDELHALRIGLEKEKKGKRSHVKGTLERVGVFVDVQNMFYAAKQFNARLDFDKLLQSTVRGRRLITAIAYLIQNPEVDQSGFVSMLQQRNYQVRRKNLRLRSDGSAKGDWDMGMAIDMISLAGKLDVIVLVSGDGDFVDLVNLLKRTGPRVEVFSFPHNTARDLIEAADEHVAITEGMLLKLGSVGGEERGERWTPKDE